MPAPQEDTRYPARQLVASGGAAPPPALPGAAAVGRRWAIPAAGRPIPLLVCAALAALIAVAAVAWHQTRALLVEQSKAHTTLVARAAVHVLAERLRGADRLLREHARAAAWRPVAATEDQTFSTLALIDREGRVNATDEASILLAEVAHDARSSLPDDSTLLVAIPRAGEPARMLLVRRVDASRRDMLLVGELRTEHLWAERTGSAWVCTVTAAGTALHCPADAMALRRAFMRGQQAASRGEARDDIRIEAFGAREALELPAGIRGPDLLAVGLQSREAALAPGARARLALLIALAGAAILVATLGMAHDRSMRHSLKQLADWTRRIAAQESGSAAVREVEPAFRSVSVPLRDVAQTLSLEQDLRAALAKVDRLLLESADLDQVARAVARRLRAVVGAAAVGIALKRASRHAPAEAEGGELYLATAAAPDRVRAAPAPFIAPAGLRQLIAAEGLWLRAPLPGDPLLAALWREGVDEALIHPVLVNATTVGVLAVGLAAAGSRAPVERVVRPFADRLALGFGNAVREQELTYHARFDGLTGLPNRRAFVARLAEEEARAQRDGSILAVLLIDLDRFKSVNDTLGHAGGDEVIRQVSERLRACVRETDFLARLSGDEFGVLLRGLHTGADVGRVAAALMRALSEPYQCGEHEQVLSASAGAAVYPVDGLTCEVLMRNADTAMHRAKESGGGKVVFFEARMTQDLTRRVTVERELRRALENDEFVLYYQPQMDVRSGELSGAEVLIRWQHPVRGLQPPAAFIDIAEQTGLIEPIGELVLRKACLQLRQWQERGLAPPRLSVNVSGRQFRRRDFAALVAVILREAGADPRDLELEITETLLMDDVDASGLVLGQLAAQGIRLAIDDFGTGYSSLAYLKRLRFDALKIDRSFVKDVVTDEDSAAIASAIIALARTLRKETVAEGVETREQLDFLREQRCDLIQGFLISKPVPADDFMSAFRTKLKDTTKLRETRRLVR
jgi:diguanylate cyclase (GGDEF)-like protein